MFKGQDEAIIMQKKTLQLYPLQNGGGDVDVQRIQYIYNAPSTVLFNTPGIYKSKSVIHACMSGDKLTKIAIE